jgi:hypothetical protein
LRGGGGTGGLGYRSSSAPVTGSRSATNGNAGTGGTISVFFYFD